MSDARLKLRRQRAEERVAGLGAQREGIVEQLTRIERDLRGAMRRADAVGVERKKLAKLARVNRATLYNWLVPANSSTERSRKARANGGSNG